MSAALSPSNTFSARLTLAAGVLVMIEAPSMSALGEIVGKLEAANDPVAPGKSGKAATAPAGQAASQTAASSAPAAVAKAAGDAGNAASTSTPATVQGAAAGSAAGEAGNVAGGGQSAPASTASSDTPAASPAVTFEALKKAFLALSTKADGRAKCEAVLASVDPKPARLSEAKPEQYAALLAAIEKASA
jgi:hypothetical protein